MVYSALLRSRAYLHALAITSILFAGSITANFYAGVYATARSSNYVSDLILSNVPVLQVDWLFVWGAVALIFFVTILCVMEPHRAPFTLGALALFYFIRSGFVVLTHIAPYPDHPLIEAGTLAQRFFGADDLFFSGHTGAPFLMALLHWKETLVRYIFLAWSIIMGVVVLLGHFHYTIDVLSAFFITYGIWHIAQLLFPRSEAMFFSGTIDESQGPVAGRA